MDNDHVYSLINVPSLEVMQNLKKEPKMTKLREQAGVNSETQEMITIKEWTIRYIIISELFQYKKSKVTIRIINIRVKYNSLLLH